MNKKGLLPLPKDSRDYSHHLTFGSVHPSEFPDEYMVQPLEIEDQKQTQFCTAFATSEAAESQFGVKFSPEWSAAKIGQLMGFSIAGRGGDMRAAMEAGRKFGYLPKDKAPFSLENKDEEFLADYKNWPIRLDAEAKKYEDDGYYAIDGPRDKFDNIRSALLLASKDANDPKRTAVVGTKWYPNWAKIGTSGVIPTPDKMHGYSLHAHRIIGWKMIDFEPYLIDQQDLGRDYGDHGLCYFPRSVVNAEFTEGMFIARKNPSPQDIKTVSWILALMEKVVSLLYKLFPPEARMQPAMPSQNIPAPAAKPAYLFDTPKNAENSIAAICQEEGMTQSQTDIITACIRQESNFNPRAVNKNPNSSDVGIVQVNDKLWIGPGKQFPSADFVLSNPVACIRWMCQMFKKGHASWWVSYSSKAYLKYMPKAKVAHA